MESVSEFIQDLMENMRIIPETYSMEDAEDDLRNFRTDGWNMPDLTAKVLYDAMQQLIKEQRGQE